MSGRMAEDLKKETESLVDGKVSSVSPTKTDTDTSRECDPLISEVLPQLPWRQRVKTFAIEYGRVGICTHLVLSLLSISTIYVGVSSGVDVKAILDWVGLSTVASDSTTKTAGTFLIAYTFYKVLTPVRWPLTFAVTPVVLRALRRRGYMLESNNPPSSPPAP
uniref:DUF1279 domain-containing protein n=1 Tax=Peronospora matthiolae TaxID=2874970 RepID=A0AAV1T9N0_9STRA